MIGAETVSISNNVITWSSTTAATRLTTSSANAGPAIRQPNKANKQSRRIVFS